MRLLAMIGIDRERMLYNVCSDVVHVLGIVKEKPERFIELMEDAARDIRAFAIAVNTAVAKMKANKAPP